MKTTKLLTMAAAVCWIVGFASTHMLQAQGGIPNTTNAGTFRQEIQAIQELGEFANISTNILGLMQKIRAIQELGEFLQMVVGLQAQGFIDESTAESLSRSAWSMIEKVATPSSIPADCHSIADLISNVDATGLKPNKKWDLIKPLKEAQCYLAQAQADLDSGNSSQALRAQFAAIQKLGEFIEKVDQCQRERLVDEPTADALETCAMNLIGTVNVNLNTGLVAYYPFNGDANDASDNGNNGTVVGAAFQTYGATNKMALQFSGNIYSYVFVPRSPSLEPVDAITISMWVKGVCGDGRGTILRKADDCEPGCFIRDCHTTTSFQLWGATPCPASAASYCGYAVFLPFTGTNWQHIVATYSRAEGLIKSYENGALISQGSLTNQLLHTGNLYIGGANVAGDDGGFNGLINEVRIYNRALTASEVQQLYLSGSGSHP